MRRSLVAVTIFLLSINPFANSSCPAQDSTKSTSELEIRAALCDIDSSDFAAAEKKLEKVLQSEPRNTYAQRLLLGVTIRNVKPGDTSPENIALARKAIEASKRALTNPQFSSKVKAGIDRQILVLYGWINEQEQTNELLRRVADSNRTPAERAEIYTILASRSWNCSYEITDLPSNKTSTRRNGKSGVSYKMPKDLREFQSARVCVTRGMEEIENAIKLDPNNESAWSFKANLSIEASKLAEMENNPAQKTTYQKQADETQKRAIELSAQRAREDEEKSKKENEERKKEKASGNTSLGNQPDDQEQLTRELTEYRAESSLDQAVEEFSFAGELVSMIVPVPIAPDPITPESSKTPKEREPLPQATPQGCFREIDGETQVLEKRNWKSFSPAGEDITVDLPDNVCSSAGGYIAASDGVMYTIVPLARTFIPLDASGVDGVLNTLARTFVGFRSRTWVRGGNSFDVKMLRKETVNDQLSKLYAYGLNSCSKRKDGMLIVYAGKTHYYTVNISGANESDQRAQRFLKSITFK